MHAPDETAAGRGRFQAAPHPSLRPFVVEYWAMARDLAAMGGFTITPDCFGELICGVGDIVAVGAGGREKLPACFLIGLLDGPLRIEAAGMVRCMAARLRPGAVGPMSVNGPGDSSRRWTDAGTIFGPRLALVSGMVERCEWQSLTVIFDEALIRETRNWKPVPTGIDLVEQFVGDGSRPTAIVARERRITGRQVERRVRELTRTSPKQIACLSRFQKARDAIWADPSIDLAGLAVDAGYSDQPHMTRHFRRFSGQTPGQFARDSASKKTWLAAQDVAFVQERAASER